MASNTNETHSPEARMTRRSFLRNLGLGTGALFGGALVGGGVTFSGLNWWFGTQMSSPPVPREGIAVLPTTVTTASGIKIHHIQTGFVAVKTAHERYDGGDGRGIPAIILDRTWTEWKPISVWAIEHPEGVLLIDTGESPNVNDPSYFGCDPGSAWFYGSFLRFSVTPEEEIAAQLATLGIRPNDVRWVIQTHLHGDHVHGIQHFEQSEILVSPLDYPASQGAVPCLYPDWLAPTLVTFSADDTPVFGQSYALTRAGDVRIVPTPGHSNGHQSVMLWDGDLTYFFAGDASFTAQSLLNSDVQGIAIDPGRLQQSAGQIQQYAMQNRTVYLPSHDAESSARLRDATPLFA